MRNIVLAMTAVLRVSFATAVLTAGLATPGFAANSVNQVKDPSSYGQRLALATQTGWWVPDLDSNAWVATASLTKG